MANTDKKRRAERDLKELWQYLDAKYFLKFNKKQLIHRINSILRDTGTSNIPDFQLQLVAAINPINSRGSFQLPSQGEQIENDLGFHEPDSDQISMLPAQKQKNKKRLSQLNSRTMQMRRHVRVVQQVQNNPEDNDDDDAYGEEIDNFNTQNYAQGQKDKTIMNKMSAIKRNNTSKLTADFGSGMHTNGSSIYRHILPRSLLKDKEIQEILEEEEMQPMYKRQKSQDYSLHDSLFNLQHINSKGTFKQFYSELFDKMDVQTNWKYNIHKNSMNFDFNDRMEWDMVQAKIRNVFDIEFKKKFQGSLQFPIQIGGSAKQWHNKQLGSSSTGQQKSQMNRYLFFISDQFEDDQKLEKKERDKFMSIHEAQFEDQDDQSDVTENECEPVPIDPNSDLKNLGFCDEENSTNLCIEKMMFDTKKKPIKFTDQDQQQINSNLDIRPSLGFISTEQVDENQSPLLSAQSPLGNKKHKKKNSMSHIIAKECGLNQELDHLIQIHQQTQKEIAQDLNTLKRNVITHQEPESINILKSKIVKEREYLQNQIIKMEIQQIAESITRVTHAKKILKPTSLSQKQSKSYLLTNQNMEDIEQNEDLEQIGLQNRPRLLRNFLKQQELQHNQNYRTSKQLATNSLMKKKQSDHVYLFRIEFDSSCGIPDAWVETKTLNYFNTLRENIFASSSQFDLIYLQNLQEVKEKNLKMQQQKNSHSQPSNSQKNSSIMQQINVKDSVALQRGKRSCTLAEMQKSQQKKASNQKSDGTKNSVGSLLDQAKMLTEGGHSNTMPVKNQSANSDSYDFCHYCKQLKNKFLLISCKYSSKNGQQIPNKSQPGSSGQLNYVPYPYEPQCYQVNDIKIHNADFQNQSQIRGLIESTKKNLKVRNLALHMAQQAIRQQIEIDNANSANNNDQSVYSNLEGGVDLQSIQMNKKIINDYSNMKMNQDQVPLPNNQLLSWLQDLDINPYTVDPFNQSQLSIDLKTLYPNLYKQLFQYSSKQSHHGNKHNSKKSIEYECKRKFCTFCLQTNFEENLNDIVRNKNWHCHHCTGYCLCTRCQRQEITTQLKGYLISLGGNLNILQNMPQNLLNRDCVTPNRSIFDQIILKTFNEHLEVTLGYNQSLYEKYPYYVNMIRGLHYEEPNKDEFDQNQFEMNQVKDQMIGSNASNQGFYVKNTSTGMHNESLNLGFTQNDKDIEDGNCQGFYNNQDEPMINNNNGAVNKFNNQKVQYALLLLQKYKDLNIPKEYEKLAVSMLFKYSIINRKMEDQVNNLGQSSSNISRKLDDQNSDKKFLDQLIKSIKSHDTDLVNRIQKRRGRKKFVLSSEDQIGTESSSQSKGLLNRREQKYLDKVNLMRDTPLMSQNIFKIQPLVNGEMQEFKENWPKSNQRCLQGLQKLLQQIDLPNKNEALSENGENKQNTALKDQMILKDQMNQLNKKNRRQNRINSHRQQNMMFISPLK